MAIIFILGLFLPCFFNTGVDNTRPDVKFTTILYVFKESRRDMIRYPEKMAEK